MSQFSREKMDKEDKKLNHEEFFKVAILKLRDVSKSRGIHTVFSGFNDAFRKYFAEDPIKVTQELARSGKIEVRPVRKGVMIYLPGDAPMARGEVGDKALCTILGEVPESNKGLVEKVISELVEGGMRKFPDDFIDGLPGPMKYSEVELPGTELRLDPHSQGVLVSPLRRFRYAARNPSEAKYILYCYGLGLKTLKIPADNHVVFSAVSSYESYCEQLRSRAFSLFVGYTHDEAAAESLTRDVERILELKGLRNSPGNG